MLQQSGHRTDTDAVPIIRQVMWGSALGVAGFAANTVPVELGFGLDFLTGTLAVYIAAFVAGWRGAATAGFIAGAYTWLLWGHP